MMPCFVSSEAGIALALEAKTPIKYLTRMSFPVILFPTIWSHFSEFLLYRDPQSKSMVLDRNLEDISRK